MSDERPCENEPSTRVCTTSRNWLTGAPMWRWLHMKWDNPLTSSSSLARRMLIDTSYNFHSHARHPPHRNTCPWSSCLPCDWQQTNSRVYVCVYVYLYISNGDSLPNARNDVVGQSPVCFICAISTRDHAVLSTRPSHACSRRNQKKNPYCTFTSIRQRGKLRLLFKLSTVDGVGDSAKHVSLYVTNLRLKSVLHGVIS